MSARTGARGSRAPRPGGVLFLIPARGGSVRVPGKNLRTVAGMPLVGRAVRTGRLAAQLGPDGPHAVVCTTDDPAIAAAAREWGGEVLDRPARLATAEATSVEVVLHALETFAAAGRAFRAVVLVQPTSPFTMAADLAAVVALHDEVDAPVVTVTPSHPATWHGDGAEGAPLEFVETHRGPNARSGLLLTGAAYAIGPDELIRHGRFVIPDRTLAHIVPPERSVDVDEEGDLTIAEGIARASLPAPVVLEPEAGDRILVGSGARAFVIAEAGVNHDGDPALAHRLIDAAADAGADAVKFQAFDPERLAAAGAPTAAYQRERAGAEDQRAMLAKLALPADAWPALRDHARDRGIVFFASPFDEASADLLERVGVPCYKVASGELTNHPFLAHLARKGRPLLVSTGMATMAEVARALDAIAAARDVPVALFHCVSSYPARPEDANLRAMATLRAAFGVPTGWSDHTPGTVMPIAAAALGADLVEKHLTLDRTMAGPDHAASLEPDQLRALVEGVRAAEAARGDGLKRPVDAEMEIARVARKSLYWTRDLAAGHAVTAADLAALRPATGLSPALRDELVGRRLARGVTGGMAASLDDLAPS